MRVKIPLFSFLFVLATVGLLFTCNRKSVTHPFDPKPGSCIVIIGNTFGEQLQQHNFFETLLYQSFPDHNLTVRNMAWSADEVSLRPRPLNFGSLDEYLSREKVDVIFASFGLNESFHGLDSLEIFKSQLSSLLEHLDEQHFNGNSSPEIILFSPIFHENLGGFLPDPMGHNRNLKAYTQAMKEVAGSLGVPFLDLHHPTKRLMERGEGPFTVNGVHLNEKGYKAVGEMMAKALDFPVSSWIANDFTLGLQELINQKNQLYFYRFRTQNGEYVFGGRRDWEGGRSLPAELAAIDTMVWRMDSLVWNGVKGRPERELTRVQNIVSPNLNLQVEEHIPPSTDQFILQDGYEIELFASEIDFPIANPVAISFDPEGRLWVASMPSYPHYLPGVPPNDKLVILEDTDKDGRADRHTVFADSLYLPLGFEIGDGGVYLTQAPDLIFLKDTDGDGKADLRKNLLHGFGTEDAHHSISAYTWGPDGALYFQEGTFLHSQVETPYGPVRGAYGNTWRYEPRSMKLESYVSYPYANPWGNVFLRDGTHIIGDVSTGMNYFATPLTVAADYPKKHVEMRDFLTTNIKPKTCGHEIVASRHFPDEAQGNILFNTFVGFQGIKQHTLKHSGSGIVAEEIEPLLQSTDLNFRPVDLKFGPDGALYVVDWFNPIIQHGEQGFRESERDHSHGRIWRITYKGRDLLEPLNLGQMNVAELLDQLKTYEDRVRYRARMQLREFSEEDVLPVLERWLAELGPSEAEFEQHRLEGLWVYQQFNHPDEGELSKSLNAKDPHIRAAATRVLFYWKDFIADAEGRLIAMSGDAEPRVRVEAIAALSHFETKSALDALLECTELPTDYYIEYALKEAFKHLRPVWTKAFNDDPEFLVDEPDKAAYLFGPLSSPGQVALPGFLKGEPDWKKYEYDLLSADDFKGLSQAPAAMRFWVTRNDIPDAERKVAVQNLAKRAGVNPTELLLEIIQAIDTSTPNHGLEGLSKLLMEQDLQEVQQQRETIKDLAATSPDEAVRQVSFSLLMEMNTPAEEIMAIAELSEEHQLSFLTGVQLLSVDSNYSDDYDILVKSIQEGESPFYNGALQDQIKTAAIGALPHLSRSPQTISMLVDLIQPNGTHIKVAAESLLKIGDDRFTEKEQRRLTERLTRVLDAVPPGNEVRVTPPSVIALSKRMAEVLPATEREVFLRKVTMAETVVVPIGTAPGQMDFDVKDFKVMAGQTIEIVFSNTDDMPHNLLILTPGSLEEVGEMADEMAKLTDGYEKGFVPQTNKVLYSTPLLNAGQSFSLLFTAPSQPGEFPYACTFPGHWRTMNGVMTVEGSL